MSDAREWLDIRAFGPLPKGHRCIIRPSAYALIRNDKGLIAVVRSHNGTFLPGGGIDKGETPEDAVRREAMEECGFRIRVGACVNRAIQYVRTDVRQKRVEKRAYFFEAQIEQEFPNRIESGHETIWIARDDAARYLSHESHTWVVSEWRGQ